MVVVVVVSEGGFRARQGDGIGIGGNLQDDTRRRLPGLQEGQKGRRHIDKTAEIDAHFPMEGREIDLIRLAEIIHALHARVEKDAVQIRILGHHVLHEGAQILGVVEIVHNAVGLAATAVPADEVVDAIPSPAHSDDVGAVAEELFGHAEANAGGGADD